jgi:hypothetical protein
LVHRVTRRLILMSCNFGIFSLWTCYTTLGKNDFSFDKDHINSEAFVYNRSQGKVRHCQHSNDQKSSMVPVEQFNYGEHSYCNSANNSTKHIQSEVWACGPAGANSESPYLRALRHNEEDTLPEKKRESCIINFKGQRMSHFHYLHPQSNRTVMEVGTDNVKYLMEGNCGYC